MFDPQVIPGWGELYLSDGPFGPDQFVEQADRDAEHRGQSQTPADDLPPPGVHVHIVVGQRFVVDQVEEENPLQQISNRAFSG